MLAFMVRGKPVTQGSMTAVYNRRTGHASVRHAQSLPLAKWRRAIKEAALEAGAQVTDAPVSMSIVFGMPRPEIHYGAGRMLKPKYRNAIPQSKDLDKLVRAVFDALTGVAFLDDKQVADIHAVRVFAPFTVIEVREIDAATLARANPNGESNLTLGFDEMLP